MQTTAEFATEFRRLSDLLDKALEFAKLKVYEAAEAERAYRAGQAKAWLEAPRFHEDVKTTAGEREAWVNGETADLRQKRDLADGLRQMGLEAIRSRRTQISMLQTALNAHKEETAFGRTGPEYTP